MSLSVCNSATCFCFKLEMLTWTHGVHNFYKWFKFTATFDAIRCLHVNQLLLISSMSTGTGTSGTAARHALSESRPGAVQPGSISGLLLRWGKRIPFSTFGLGFLVAILVTLGGQGLGLLLRIWIYNCARQHVNVANLYWIKITVW